MSKKSSFLLVVFVLFINISSLAFASDISSLIKDLRNKDKAKETAGKLAKIGKPAVPELIKALRGNNKCQKRYAARAIRDIGQAGSDAIPALEKLLKEWDAGTREYAVEALGNMVEQSEQVIPILKRAREDSEKDVRKKAKRAIQNIESKIAEIKRKQQQAEQMEKKVEQTEKTKTYNLRGYEYMESGNYQEAESSFKQSLKIAPSAEGYKGLGDVYYELANNGHVFVEKNWLGSAYYYERAIEIDRDFSDAYKGLGNTYFRTEQYNESLKCYKKVLSYDPNDADVLENLGFVYYQLGDYEEAIKTFNRALAVDPNSVSPYRTLSICYTKQNRNDLAIESAQKAINNYPNDYELISNMGFAYYKLGNFDEAINSFIKVIAIKPNIPELYIGLANAYCDSGQYQKSVNAYNEVLKLNIDLLDAYKGLADVYGKMGNQKDLKNVKDKIVRLEIKPVYERYKNKYAWYNGKYIYFPNFDVEYSNSRKGQQPEYYESYTEWINDLKSVWDYHQERQLALTSWEKYREDNEHKNSLELPKWAVGEYGRAYGKQAWAWGSMIEFKIFQILGPDEMLIEYYDEQAKLARFKGWPTKNLIDGESWDFNKKNTDSGVDIAIVGTYRYITAFGTTKTILDVVPLELFRKGITFEQFTDMLRKNNDLPKDLQKIKLKLFNR